MTKALPEMKNSDQVFVIADVSGSELVDDPTTHWFVLLMYEYQNNRAPSIEQQLSIFDNAVKG